MTRWRAGKKAGKKEGEKTLISQGIKGVGERRPSPLAFYEKRRGARKKKKRGLKERFKESGHGGVENGDERWGLHF